MPIDIPGLPEGVLCARLGQCEADEFELHGQDICKGPRGFSQMVVTPAEGYQFVFNMATNQYSCVKKLPGEKRKMGVYFEFANHLDFQRAEKAVRTLPGFVNLSFSDVEKGA